MRYKLSLYITVLLFVPVILFAQSFNLSNIPKGSFITTEHKQNPFVGFENTYIYTETLRAPGGEEIMVLYKNSQKESTLIEAFDTQTGRYIESGTFRGASGIYQKSRALYDVNGNKLLDLAFSNGKVRSKTIGYNPSTGAHIEEQQYNNTTITYFLFTPGETKEQLFVGTLPSGFVLPSVYFANEQFIARSSLPSLIDNTLGSNYTSAFFGSGQNFKIAEFSLCDIVSMPLDYLGEGEEMILIAGGDNTHTNISQGQTCNQQFNIVKDFNIVSDWNTADGFTNVDTWNNVDAWSPVQSGGDDNKVDIFNTNTSGEVASTKTFKDLVLYAFGIINRIIPILVSLALLLFFWGMARFINNAGSEEAITNGKQMMIWGVISLFVMVSILGILQLLLSDVGANLVIPQLPTGQ